MKNGGSSKKPLQGSTTPPPPSSKDVDLVGQATQIYSTVVPLISKSTKDSSNKAVAIDPRTLTALLLQHIGTSNRLAEIVRKLENHVSSQSKSTRNKVTIPYSNQREILQTTSAPQLFRRAQLNDYEEKNPTKTGNVPFSKSPHFYSDKGQGQHRYDIRFSPNSGSNTPHQQVYRPLIQPQQASQKTETVSKSNPQTNIVTKKNKINPPPVIQKRISRLDQPGVTYESQTAKPVYGGRINGEQKKSNRNINHRPTNDHNERNESGDQSGSQSAESSSRSSEEFGAGFGRPVPGFHDVFEDPEPVSDNAPSFVVPKLDLRPESLQQKGCRTVVKEVQQFPLDGHLKASGSELFHTFGRVKRDTTPPPRRVTSIIMTKECHFPGDEASATEERPKYYQEDPRGSTKTYYPYDDNTDILKKVSSSRIPSSVASEPNYYSQDDNPEPGHVYGSESSRDDYPHPKSDFEFDMELPEYLKTSSEDYRSYPDDHEEGGKHRAGNRDNSRNNKKGKPPAYVVKQVFPKGGKEKGDGKKPKVYVTITSSDQPKSASSDNHGSRAKSGNTDKKGGKKVRPTPKTVNRSFAVFSRDDGDEKDPNNKEYSMSYSQGKFSSFAEDYDSDRDGY